MPATAAARRGRYFGVKVVPRGAWFGLATAPRSQSSKLGGTHEAPRGDGDRGTRGRGVRLDLRRRRRPPERAALDHAHVHRAGEQGHIRVLGYSAAYKVHGGGTAATGLARRRIRGHSPTARHERRPSREAVCDLPGGKRLPAVLAGP